MNTLENIPGFELPTKKVVAFQPPVVDEGGSEVATQNDLLTLSNMIRQWRELKVQMKTLEESISEKKKHFKVLDAVIMRQMKRFSIGALDLQSSGGRILYEKRKVVAGLNPKSLEDMLKDYLKSEDEAKKIVEFIKENRETRVKESLKYETE